jgi:hypothetical protein
LSNELLYERMAKGIVLLKWRTAAEQDAFANLEMCRNMAVIELARLRQAPVEEMQDCSNARLLSFMMHLIGEEEAAASMATFDDTKMLTRMVSAILSLKWRQPHEGGSVTTAEEARNIIITELAAMGDINMATLQGMTNAQLLVVVEKDSGFRVPVASLVEDGVDDAVISSNNNNSSPEGVGAVVSAPAAAGTVVATEATEADFAAMRKEIHASTDPLKNGSLASSVSVTLKNGSLASSVSVTASPASAAKMNSLQSLRASVIKLGLHPPADAASIASEGDARNILVTHLVSTNKSLSVADLQAMPNVELLDAANKSLSAAATTIPVVAAATSATTAPGTVVQVADVTAAPAVVVAAT